MEKTISVGTCWRSYAESGYVVRTALGRVKLIFPKQPVPHNISPQGIIPDNPDDETDEELPELVPSQS